VLSVSRSGNEAVYIFPGLLNSNFHLKPKQNSVIISMQNFFGPPAYFNFQIFLKQTSKGPLLKLFINFLQKMCRYKAEGQKRPYVPTGKTFTKSRSQSPNKHLTSFFFWFLNLGYYIRPRSFRPGTARNTACSTGSIRPDSKSDRTRNSRSVRIRPGMKSDRSWPFFPFYARNGNGPSYVWNGDGPGFSKPPGFT
jgi:hypothetical protein